MELPNSAVDVLDYHMDWWGRRRRDLHHKRFIVRGQISPDVPVLESTHALWLDLSRLAFNPFLLDSFSNDIRLGRGWVEITLRPRFQDVLKDPYTDDGPDQHGSMHNMFVTRPPCKSLGIYIIHSPGRFEKLASVDAACGIRVKQQLEAIYECAPTAVKRWQGQAQSLRKAIASLDTTSKAQVTVPGFPKVFLFLEMHLHEPKPGHVTAMFANLASDMYFFDSKSKNVWEDEWMNGDQDKQDKQWSK